MPANALGEARDVIARLAQRTGIELTTDELLESPHIFIGTIDALEQKLIRTREELAISSFIVEVVGELDPLVERLAGR